MAATMQPQNAEEQLLLQMELDEHEFARRKEFLEFGQPEVEALAGLQERSKKYADEVIEELYKHFLSFEETRAFFHDPAALARVKQMQKDYFLRLTSGDYGPEYLANRVRIGVVHERVGLGVKWYLGAYCFYLRQVASRLIEELSAPSTKSWMAFSSLLKLVFLDMGLAIEAYTHQREETIRRQQEAIMALERERAQLKQQEVLRELSTPVLQLRDRLLLLPIVGVIDSQRARQLTESLLCAIRAKRARVVVIDITGVAEVDSKVANHLVKTVAAAKLMGAGVIVTGLSAEVSMALVALGVDLGRINTVGDLQGGIEEAERLLGYRVTRVEEYPGLRAPSPPE